MVSGRRSKIPDDEQPPSRPPAKTPEGREQQLVNYAINLAEKQLLEGTAASQVITHFLKLGTEREKLERRKIEQENLLLQARVDNLNASQNSEKMYKDALDAMRRYSGQEGTKDGYNEAQHPY